MASFVLPKRVFASTAMYLPAVTCCHMDMDVDGYGSQQLLLLADAIGQFEDAGHSARKRGKGRVTLPSSLLQSSDWM